MAYENKNTNLAKEYKCAIPVELIKTVGSFVNEDGVSVDYCKFTLQIRNTRVDLSVDKTSKGLIDDFVPFKEIEVK